MSRVGSEARKTSRRGRRVMRKAERPRQTRMRQTAKHSVWSKVNRMLRAAKGLVGTYSSAGTKVDSLIAARIASAEGTLVSLPDSSLNILHENPTLSSGSNSVPLIKMEGEPVRPRAAALLRSILYSFTSAWMFSMANAAAMFSRNACSEAQSGDR